MLGWNKKIGPVSTRKDGDYGWGSEIKNDLTVGRAKYEYGVFVDGTLTKVFRTDVEDLTYIIEGEVNKHIRYLKREDPNKKYHWEVLEK